MDVLKKINKLRLERDWSIYRLSVESGIPQSTLTNMFNRETLPSITTLELICHAFGISMADFFSEPSTPDQRTFDSAELLQVFQALDDDSKQIVFDLMRHLEKKA